MHLVPMTIIGLIGSLHRVVPPTPKSVPNRERDSRNCFTGAENRWVQRSFRVGDYVTPTAHGAEARILEFIRKARGE